MINSTSSISLTNSYSVLPMTHVIEVVGQCFCMVLKTGSVCEISPSADKRNKHSFSGGDD